MSVAPPLPHDPLWPRAGGWGDVNGEPVDVILVGVPTEKTSLSPTHAAGTPHAIREALRRYSTSYLRHEGTLLDLESLSVRDAGDLADPDTESGREAAVERLAELHTQLVPDGLLIALGGDNAATFPVARALAGAEPARAGVITLDAHLDLRDGRSNGSPIRELLEAGITGANVVQIGIADFANSRAYYERALSAGITVIARSEVESETLETIAEDALDRAGSAGGRIHLDVDVDVCDRSVAPGTPASVPGGLSAWELRRLVRMLCADPRVASIDITEVDHLADSADQRTVRLAALVVLEALAGVALRRR